MLLDDGDWRPVIDCSCYTVDWFVSPAGIAYARENFDFDRDRYYIEVPDGDLEKLAGELSNILSWVEQLSEVDTDDVEPMTSVVPMTLRRRTDEVTDGGIREDVLANAPDRRADFFAVPKVVE